MKTRTTKGVEVPPDRPDFVCRHCGQLMCEDCLSNAAEYEFLAGRRGGELARIQEKVEGLELDLKRERRMHLQYRQIATLGMHETLVRFIDSETGRAVLCRPDELVLSAAQDLLEYVEQCRYSDFLLREDEREAKIQSLKDALQGARKGRG